MFQYQSPIPQMIQSGQFGVNSPIQQTGYNPYMNQQQPQIYGNTYIPQYQQPQVYGNPYSNITSIGMPQYQQPQQNNNFVFQPINNNYTYYQEPRYNYYDPYGAGQQNPYAGYQNYGGYSPFITPAQQQRQVTEQVELMKIKHRIVAGFYGKTLDEEELDRLVNPQNKANIPTAEEVANIQEAQFMNYLSTLARMPPQYKTATDIEAEYMRLYSENLHRELDNHSMAQFFDEDLWKLQREEWIRENISKNYGRNLSTTYNSNDYNELLNMHRSSNPYINKLMDDSRYDNNIDDLELGMNIVYDKERRRQAILEGRIPSFISSKENQERRNKWTNSILDQIYEKGGRLPNV